MKKLTSPRQSCSWAGWGVGRGRRRRRGGRGRWPAQPTRTGSPGSLAGTPPPAHQDPARLNMSPRSGREIDRKMGVLYGPHFQTCHLERRLSLSYLSLVLAVIVASVVVTYLGVFVIHVILMVPLIFFVPVGLNVSVYCSYL
jgi:hypothetical protein